MPTTTSTPPDSLTLRVEGAEGSVGQTIPVEVVLYNVTDGISGFDLNLSIQDRTVACIAGVSMPTYHPPMLAGLTTVEISNTHEESSAHVRVADFMGLLNGDFTAKAILRLNLKLLKSGSTLVNLQKNQMDSDNSELPPLEPVPVPGSVTVSAQSQ